MISTPSVSILILIAIAVIILGGLAATIYFWRGD